MLRIDRAKVAQGLIRSAKSYTLVLNDDGLYLLHVGPAPGLVVQPKNFVEKGAINFALNRVERKIKDGEDRLAKASIDEWAKGKHSAFYRCEDVESAEMDTNYAGEPRLVIQAGRKKWKLVILDPDVDTANELTSALSLR